MQTINMNSELVCRYIKLYDNMCKCNNINVNFIAKYAKYNVHGPLGRNYVQVYLNEGIEMENENARRKICTKLFNNLVDDGDDDVNMSATVHQIVELCAWRGERVYRPHDHNNFNEEEIDALKELGTSRTHSAVIRCLTICQHIPVVRKNHKNQLTQQFDIICCLARCLALCIESKQIMSLLSCESATLKRGPQLCGQRCGPYLRH